MTERNNKYQVWMEGFLATGDSAEAQRLTRENEATLWEGATFQQACKNAMSELKWDMSYYDEETNRYWACRFFDNETDARKSFG